MNGNIGKEKNLDNPGNSDNDKSKAKTKAIEKQINVLVITIIVITIILFGSMFVLKKVHYANNHFNFHGFNYTIESYPVKTGKPILIYHTKFTLKPKNKNAVIYNLYLHNDPRQIEHFETNDTFKFTRLVYLGFQPDLKCKGMSLPAIEVSQLLGAMNLKAEGAILYNSTIPNRGVTITNCSTTNSTVIQLFMSKQNQTAVTTSKNDRCINLEFKDCDDMIPVSEAFLLSLVDRLSGYS